MINDAKKSIDIPVFYLTDKYIAGDLIKAKQRGVAIRIIIDATSAQNGYTKHEILRAAGIPVKVENWSGKMHMKSMIVDNEYVVIGSMNFTTAGTRTNDENTLIIRNSYYANEATIIFEALWNSIPSEWLKNNPDPESYDSSNSLTDGIDNDFDDLIDADDLGNLIPIELPPYQIVPKENGYNL